MSLTGEYNYTLNLETKFNNMTSELENFYCREDFEYQLNRLDTATPDSKLFCQKDLEALCFAKQINMKELIQDRSLLEQILTREEMKEKLLQFFYDIYKETPTAQEIMKRIVRILAPEYKNDTIRVAILKKFVLGAGDNFKCFNTDSIIKWVTNQLNDTERREKEALDKEKQKAFIISKIEDNIFDNLQVSKLSSDEIISLIIQCRKRYSKIANLDELQWSEETKKMVDELLQEQGICIVDKTNIDKILEIQEDIKNVELEVAESIEKDFRKQLKGINRIAKSGKQGTYDDLYKDAKKDAKNKKNKGGVDKKLLGLCDDLEKGNFRANGVTKKYLYYFAFMFEMKITWNAVKNEDQDIIKNMFQDFYNDNLLRFLEGDYKDGRKLTTVENEPTGEGINYKNYTEAIYLYFLYHEELNMMPGEKIDMAEDIIKKCVKYASKNKKNISKQNDLWNTRYYQDNLIYELLQKKPEDIVEFITEKYSITTEKNSNRIMINSEEKTAFFWFGKIIEKLEEMRNEKIDISSKEWRIKKLLEEKFGHEDEDFNRILQILDDRTRLKSMYLSKYDIKEVLGTLDVLISNMDKPITRYLLEKQVEEKGLSSKKIGEKLKILRELGFDIKNEKGDTYCLQLSKDDSTDSLKKELIECIKNKNCISDEELERKIRSRVIKEKRITRNELIVLHYYYTVMEKGDFDLDFDGVDTLQTVFKKYSEMIDPILEACRYQPLNKKNIFDMYMIIELYFYISDLDLDMKEND